jgi:hypothetical protein
MAQTLTFTGGQLDGRTMSLSGVTSGQNNAAANTNYLLLPGGCDLTNPTVQANYITVIPASGLTLVSPTFAPRSAIPLVFQCAIPFSVTIAG